MSNLTVEVTSIVYAMGRATVDDMASRLQGVTKQQIIKAIGNAKARGFVVLVGKTKSMGKYGGGCKGIYARPEHATKPLRIPVARPVASVWDMADRPTVPEWPMPFDGGRVFALMGMC